MKFFKNDVVLLLCFLLLFCFGFSFLRNDQKDALFYAGHLEREIPPSEQMKTAYVASKTKPVSHRVVEHNLSDLETNGCETLADLSTEQLFNYMKPLFMTKSASAIIAFLKHIPSDSVFHIVQAIVQDTILRLPPRAKIRIIFAAVQRQRDIQKKYDFFDLITQNKRLHKGAKPLLVKAVEAGYAHLVPDILAWATKVHMPDIAKQSLLYAAQHDDEDPEALRELFEAGVQVGSTMASDLLWELTGSCCEGYSVSFLVNKLRADCNYVRSHQTPLARAVQNNNIGVALELLKHGANPSVVFSDGPIKTALQIAQSNGSPEMQEILRNYGA